MRISLDKIKVKIKRDGTSQNETKSKCFSKRDMNIKIALRRDLALDSKTVFADTECVETMVVKTK